MSHSAHLLLQLLDSQILTAGGNPELCVSSRSCLSSERSGWRPSTSLSARLTAALATAGRRRFTTCFTSPRCTLSPCWWWAAATAASCCTSTSSTWGTKVTHLYTPVHPSIRLQHDIADVTPPSLSRWVVPASQRHWHYPEGPDEDSEDDGGHRAVLRGMLDSILPAGDLVLVPAWHAACHTWVRAPRPLCVWEPEHLLRPCHLWLLHAVLQGRSCRLLPPDIQRHLAAISGPAVCQAGSSQQGNGPCHQQPGGRLKPTSETAGGNENLNSISCRWIRPVCLSVC